MEAKLAIKIDDERVFTEFRFKPAEVKGFYVTNDDEEGIKYCTIQLGDTDYSLLYTENLYEDLLAVIE